MLHCKKTVYIQWVGSSVVALFAGMFFVFFISHVFPFGEARISHFSFSVAGLIQFVCLQRFFSIDHALSHGQFRLCETRFATVMTTGYCALLILPILLLSGISPEFDVSVCLYLLDCGMLLWFGYLFLLIPADSLVAFDRRLSTIMCFASLTIGHYGFVIFLPVYFFFRKETSFCIKMIVLFETLFFAVFFSALISACSVPVLVHDL